jgi:hypothetical protein
MTDLRLISYLEQMEAHRTSFNELWKKYLIYHPSICQMTEKDRLPLMDLCWLAYIEGAKKLCKP